MAIKVVFMGMNIMNRIKNKPLAQLLGFTLGALLAGYSVEMMAQGSMDRATLLEKSVQLPSEQINTKVMRVKFTPGFKTPWHTHEGPGPRYVVKGTLSVVENGKTNVYHSGDVFWETGSLMSVENTGSDQAELIIFELAPAKK